jgi:tripartite-type tricarboxylate transporter receptor subunit TctC
MIACPRALLAMVAMWTGLGIASAACAGSYPEQAIKLVVPFPAGGATDTIARLVAHQVSSALRQPVIVENRGGAGGSIAARAVAAARPDGYTLMMAAVSTFGTAPLLYKFDFEPVRAFAPVATVAIDRGVMVVNPSVPVNTVQELVQYAKANPGKLNYGSAIGIGPHLVMELFKRRTGTDIVHVPYRGGAAVIADLIGGQIQMTINNKSVLLPHIQQGRIRALAVTGAERWPELPGVPTLVESGDMDLPYDTWFGVVTPAGAPGGVIEKLNVAINEGLRSSAMRASLASIGIDPKVSTPAEFAALIADEVPKWERIVKLTGIKAE